MVFLFTLLTLAAGECDVYNEQSSIEHCHKTQECINTAFFSNRNNLYVLDQVFRSTRARPPLALFVNYHVTIVKDTLNDSLSVGDNGSSSGEDDGNETTVYVEQLGWTSVGLYTVISPVLLVSLQPHIFITTFSYLVNENYNFPKSIHLKLKLTNTTECNLPKGTTQSEVKEALEHLTMNVSP